MTQPRRIFWTTPKVRRRLVMGALVIWLGLHIGAAGLGLATTGKLEGALLTFTPRAQLNIVFLAAALAPLDLRLSRERVFLANLGVGPLEAALVCLLSVAALEAGIWGLMAVAF